MRQLVEPPAARFAAGRASLDDLARISDAMEAMAPAIGDMAAYAKADVAFHMAVFAASHNPLLKRFAHTVANFLQVASESSRARSIPARSAGRTISRPMSRSPTQSIAAMPRQPRRR